MMETLAPYFNSVYNNNGEVESYVVYYETLYQWGQPIGDDCYYLLSDLESLFDESFIFETNEGEQKFVFLPFYIKDVAAESMTELVLQILDCVENVEIKEVLLSE